jgi:AcrR family transcriptional regulator
MPRHVDPEVEKRIVDAARKLWHKGGEKALSMRAIAKAAGTNTPAVYRRFRGREEILQTLVQFYQRELFETLEPCTSLREMAGRYLDFAVRRPREYELIMSGLLAKAGSRPNFDLALNRSSEWLGGSPADHAPLIHALYSLVHGHAMLTMFGSVKEQAGSLRAALLRAVDVLVSNEAKIRKSQEAR